MIGTQKQNAMVAALESALKIQIEKIDAPGTWSVNHQKDEYIQLVWECEACDDELADMYGDEPWSKWGGNAIIEAASIEKPDNSGIDRYINKYGEDIITHWVQWDAVN